MLRYNSIAVSKCYQYFKVAIPYPVAMTLTYPQKVLAVQSRDLHRLFSRSINR